MASTNFGTLAASFVVGAGLAALVTYGITQSQTPEVPPCVDPPGTFHTIIIALDRTVDPPALTVKPMLVENVQQCDVVSFVNLTGNDVTVDFSPAAGGQGTPFNDAVAFTIPAGSEGEAASRAPQVIIEAPVNAFADYAYAVGGFEQSPVIRIGPVKSDD